MLIPESQVRIWLYAPPTDMRKSFDGLSALVRTKLVEDPLSGQLFVFINRRRDRMKLLHFSSGGFWLYYRLLESGTFETLKAKGGSNRLQIDATELSMLLSGVSLAKAGKRRKRFVA